MIKNKKKVLSIVIKNEHIKLSEASKNGKSIKVYSACLVDTPVGVVSDGMIEDMDALEDALKAALKEHKMECKDVVFSIVSGKVATKEVVIPEVKENKIADIVMANASEYFPVEISEYIIKHTVLEKFVESDVKKLRLQLVAAPKNMIELYQMLAERLGLHIVDVDYSGNSIYQLLNQQIGPEYCAVIDIEGEGTVVSIFQGNVLKMQRTVPYGRSILIEAVMRKYLLKTEEDVRRKLYEEKILHISFDSDAVTESLSYLVNGVKRITDYYVSRNDGQPFEKVYVVGDAVTIPGFVTLLANEMGTDLTPMETLEGVVLADEAIEIERDITEYISALGALIAPISLYVEQQNAKVKKNNDMKMLGILVAVSAVVSVFLVVVPLMEVKSLEKKIEKTQKHINELLYVEEIVGEYYQAKDKKTDAMAFSSMTTNSNDYLHIFLGELEKKMPTDIAIGSMNVSSGSVSLSGTAASKSSLAKFIQQLNSIESVANVYIGSESENMDNVGAISVSFTLTCTFNEVTESEMVEGEEQTEAPAAEEPAVN